MIDRATNIAPSAKSSRTNFDGLSDKTAATPNAIAATSAKIWTAFADALARVASTLVPLFVCEWYPRPGPAPRDDDLTGFGGRAS